MKPDIKIWLWVSPLFFAVRIEAQKENALIRKGNHFYKEQKLDQSKLEYQKAIQQSPENPTAHYNLGNAQYRSSEWEDAASSYEQSIHNSNEKSFSEKGYYNKGVALIRDQKLAESIDSWKQALKLDPNDQEARENLQKALMELKKQQSQQNKENQKQQSKDQEEQPKPQPSKLSKQQVEQLLKALEQKEKNVQDKMNQNRVKSLSQPDKDW